MRETLARVSEERKALARVQETMQAEKRALEEKRAQLLTEQRKVTEERREVELMRQQLQEKNYTFSASSCVRKTMPISPRGNSISPKLFSGVKQNVPIDGLLGWKMIYCAPYSHHTTMADLMPPEELRGGALLLGARRAGSDTLAVAAMGNAETVTRATDGNKSETHFHNGVYWYCKRNKSIGFSPGPLVNLHLWAAADEHDPHSAERLCWRLNGRGGYRAGTNLNLASSEVWEKLIFATPLKPFDLGEGAPEGSCFS